MGKSYSIRGEQLETQFSPYEDVTRTNGQKRVILRLPLRNEEEFAGYAQFLAARGIVYWRGRWWSGEVQVTDQMVKERNTIANDHWDAFLDWCRTNEPFKGLVSRQLDVRETLYECAEFLEAMALTEHPLYQKVVETIAEVDYQ